MRILFRIFLLHVFILVFCKTSYSQDFNTDDYRKKLEIYKKSKCGTESDCSAAANRGQYPYGSRGWHLIYDPCKKSYDACAALAEKLFPEIYLKENGERLKKERSIKDSLRVVEDSVRLVEDSKIGSHIIDSRDGQKYEVVRIGRYIWLAEDMRYYIPGSLKTPNGFRLYNWEQAQKACPEGWVLPTFISFVNVAKLYGGLRDADGAMKSIKGWQTEGIGTNESGFNAKPVDLPYRSSFWEIGRKNEWWTSSETTGLFDKKAAFSFRIYDKSSVGAPMGLSTNTKLETFYSCRCVRFNYKE